MGCVAHYWEIQSLYRHRLEDASFSISSSLPGPHDCPGKEATSFATVDFWPKTIQGAPGITREGANREKLTVKKIINNEMFFFHRLCPL